MLSIQHELLRAQPALAREIVEHRGGPNQLIPRCRRMNVHFDDAWIRSHLQYVDSRIERGRVAFDQHGHFQIGSGIFDCRDQVEIVRKILHWRHKHKQLPVSRLNAKGRACYPGRGFTLLRRLSMVRARFGIIRKRRPGEQVTLAFRLFGQVQPLLEWIGIVGIGNVLRFRPRKRFEGQSIPHGRIAGDEKHFLRREKPRLAGPAWSA